MAKRHGTAEWQGGGKEGKGTMSVASGTFSGSYSFSTRFEEEPGTNPEELIGAAHAGCFSMALSFALADAGHSSESITTRADVHLRMVDGNPTISRIDLHTEGRVPGIDQGEFERFAQQAKEGCPVSRALSGVGEITLEAKLL